MVGAQAHRRSKSGICSYARAAAAGGYYGSTMATTDRKGSQGSSRNSITRRRRRSLVYLTFHTAVTKVRPIRVPILISRTQASSLLLKIFYLRNKIFNFSTLHVRYTIANSYEFTCMRSLKDGLFGCVVMQSVQSHKCDTCMCELGRFVVIRSCELNMK